jgi:hypothetical protein
MFLAPKGKKFPSGKIDWWCVDNHTKPDVQGGPGKLSGQVEQEYTWPCTIPLNYPTGEYTVFIRVYDYLPTGQRPVIREKVETIAIVDEE